MTPETQGNESSNTPVRSALEMAMAGERPMENRNNTVEMPSTPIQSALEKAMNGERPPIMHDSNIPISPTNESNPGDWESKGSSQTDIDLNKYNETLTPSTATVVQNWEKNLTNTPSIVVAKEEKTPENDKTTTRDLHQEALDSNKKANEGFTGGFTQTGTNALRSQDTIAELARDNATLMERLDKMQATLDQLLAGSTAPYNQDPALAAALDPNNPNRTDYDKPLRDAFDPMNQSLNETQIQFAKDVAEEDRLHNPLNPGYISPEIPPVIPEVPPVIPEIPPVIPEIPRTPDARRKLKVAYIAGAVIGGSTGILGGIPAAGVGALVCIAGGLLNTGLNKLSNSNVERWDRRLATVTDPTERANLEKRARDWSKIKNFTETTTRDFLKGARHGLLASSIFSGAFLGGHGLAWNTPQPIMPTNPTSSGPSHTEPTTPPSSTETAPFDSGLIKDGRAYLPGDVSNGNLATGPVGNLPGGALNSSNFAGGPSDRGFWELNNYLNSAHIKATDLAAAGGDLHRMGYALQVDPSRTLPDLLNQFGGSSLLH